MTKQKLFIEFLREHDILIEFIATLAMSTWSISDIQRNKRVPINKLTLSQYLELSDSTNYVMDSFLWLDNTAA